MLATRLLRGERCPQSAAFARKSHVNTIGNGNLSSRSTLGRYEASHIDGRCQEVVADDLLRRARGVLSAVDFSHHPNAGCAANERFDPGNTMTEHIIVSRSSLGKPVAHQVPLSIRLFFPMVPSWFWAASSTTNGRRRRVNGDFLYLQQREGKCCATGAAHGSGEFYRKKRAFYTQLLLAHGSSSKKAELLHFHSCERGRREALLLPHLMRPTDTIASL